MLAGAGHGGLLGPVMYMRPDFHVLHAAVMNAMALLLSSVQHRKQHHVPGPASCSSKVCVWRLALCKPDVLCTAGAL